MLPTTYSKRDWIYAGLGHPTGIVAHPKSTRRRLQPGSKLALIGDEHAAGLAPFVRQLALERGIGFHFEAETGACIERWYTERRFAEVIANKPTVLLMSMGTCSPLGSILPALRTMAKDAKRSDVLFAWIRPPDENLARPLRVVLRAAGIHSFHSETVDVHRAVANMPSARGYAGWAGTLWRWLS